MRKLALSDEILLQVDKAARYIGGEVNSIMKDKKEVTTRVAFCFPDVCDQQITSTPISQYIVSSYVILYMISCVI